MLKRSHNKFQVPNKEECLGATIKKEEITQEQILNMLKRIEKVQESILDQIEKVQEVVMDLANEVLGEELSDTEEEPELEMPSTQDMAEVECQVFQNCKKC